MASDGEDTAAAAAAARSRVQVVDVADYGPAAAAFSSSSGTSFGSLAGGGWGGGGDGSSSVAGCASSNSSFGGFTAGRALTTHSTGSSSGGGGGGQASSATTGAAAAAAATASLQYRRQLRVSGGVGGSGGAAFQPVITQTSPSRRAKKSPAAAAAAAASLTDFARANQEAHGLIQAAQGSGQWRGGVRVATASESAVPGVSTGGPPPIPAAGARLSTSSSNQSLQQPLQQQPLAGSGPSSKTAVSSAPSCGTGAVNMSPVIGSSPKYNGQPTPAAAQALGPGVLDEVARSPCPSVSATSFKQLHSRALRPPQSPPGAKAHGRRARVAGSPPMSPVGGAGLAAFAHHDQHQHQHLQQPSPPALSPGVPSTRDLGSLPNTSMFCAQATSSSTAAASPASDSVGPTVMCRCRNIGCGPGVLFNALSNAPDACSYHPGTYHLILTSLDTYLT
jgi:hypothetical protein